MFRSFSEVFFLPRLLLPRATFGRRDSHLGCGSPRAAQSPSSAFIFFDDFQIRSLPMVGAPSFSREVSFLCPHGQRLVTPSPPLGIATLFFPRGPPLPLPSELKPPPLTDCRGRLFSVLTGLPPMRERFFSWVPLFLVQKCCGGSLCFSPPREREALSLLFWRTGPIASEFFTGRCPHQFTYFRRASSFLTSPTTCPSSPVRSRISYRDLLVSFSFSRRSTSGSRTPPFSSFEVSSGSKRPPLFSRLQGAFLSPSCSAQIEEVSLFFENRVKFPPLS